MNDVVFGQYFPADSLVHRTDPRLKLIVLVAYIALIFCSFNYYALILVTLATLIIVLLSRVPIKMYLKSLKVIVVIVLITSVLNLFYGKGEPIFQFWIIKITIAGINNAVFVSVRILNLILISSSLTFTTSPTDLTDAIERLMKPLKIFHIKVHEIALMMTIALRFIPTLLEETNKIMAAQKARGADLESGKFSQRIKALVPILIPLFVSAFRRAFDLAIAMECRCYQGGDGRTRMKQLHLKKSDACVIVFSILLTAGVVLCDLLPHTV